MSKKDYSVGHSSRFVKYITKLSEANSKEEEVDLVRTDLTKMKAELSGNSTSSFDRILEAAKEDAYYDDGDDNERKHQQNGDVEDITTRSGKKYSYKDLKLKEVVVRLLHAEMCGEHADFAHIQCVHLLPSSYFLFKKTAYVGLATCVSPESEYYYLVIAQLQKDCKSDNYIEVAAALTAAARCLRGELSSVVEGDVMQLLTHKRAMVRRKAVEALHAFFKLAWVPGDSGGSKNEYLATQYLPLFRQALCDTNPAVMSAAVRFFHYFILFANPHVNKEGGGEEHFEVRYAQLDLLQSFLTILKQVIQRRLPEQYEYHHTPAPWLQMQLIQLITCLMGQKLLLDANPSQPSSSNMVLLGTVLATLSDVMQRADNGMFIGFSVICEAVRAVSNLLPAYDFSSCLDDDNNNNNSEHHGVSTAIFELATQAIDKFLTSKSPNVRYSGVEALCALTQHNSKFALPHQTQVMLLLENKDEEESLLRVTIDLLLTMASAQNVDTIVHQVLHFIKRKSVHNNAHTTSLTPLLKMRATRGLIGLAGRYSSTPAAFIRLMHRIFFTAPEYIYREDVQLVLQVISHSFSESLFFPPEGADNNNNNTTDLFRIHLVELYYTLLGGDVRVFFNNNSNQDINPLLRHFLFYKGVLHHASSDCMSRSNTSLDNANSSTLMYENSLTSTTSVREGTPLTVGNSRLFTEKVVSQIKNFNLKNKIKIIPESVYKVGAWTIGEYGHLVQAYYHRHTSNNNNNNVGLGNAVFISLLLDSFEHCEEIETKSYILSALMKLTTNALHDNNNQNNNGELEDVLEHLTDQLTKYSKSHSVAVQQQCCEFLILLRQFPKVMKKMYHPNNNNNNNNNEEVDARLPFLDSIVQLAREKGAKEYSSNKQRSQPRRSVSSATTDGLKTKAYQPPSVGNAMTLHNNNHNNPMGVRNFFNQEFSIHNNNNNSALFSADAPNPTNLSNMFPDETITISSEVKRWGLNTSHHNSNNNTNNIVMSNSLTNSAIATHNNGNASNEQNAMSDFHQNNNNTANVNTANNNNKTEEKTVKNKKLMNDIFGGAKPKESQPIVKKVVSLDKVQINNNNNTKNPKTELLDSLFTSNNNNNNNNTVTKKDDPLEDLFSSIDNLNIRNSHKDGTASSIVSTTASVSTVTNYNNNNNYGASSTDCYSLGSSAPIVNKKYSFDFLVEEEKKVDPNALEMAYTLTPSLSLTKILTPEENNTNNNNPENILKTQLEKASMTITPPPGFSIYNIYTKDTTHLTSNLHQHKIRLDIQKRDANSNAVYVSLPPLSFNTPFHVYASIALTTQTLNSKNKEKRFDSFHSFVCNHGNLYNVEVQVFYYFNDALLHRSEDQVQNDNNNNSSTSRRQESLLSSRREIKNTTIVLSDVLRGVNKHDFDTSVFGLHWSSYQTASSPMECYEITGTIDTVHGRLNFENNNNNNTNSNNNSFDFLMDNNSFDTAGNNNNKANKYMPINFLESDKFQQTVLEKGKLTVIDVIGNEAIAAAEILAYTYEQPGHLSTPPGDDSSMMNSGSDLFSGMPQQHHQHHTNKDVDALFGDTPSSLSLSGNDMHHPHNNYIQQKNMYLLCHFVAESQNTLSVKIRSFSAEFGKAYLKWLRNIKYY